MVVEQIPRREILDKRAAEHFRMMALDRGGAGSGHTNIRGVVAFVRHNMTNYESLLEEVEGKPGASLAYLRIKERVNALICERLGVKLEVLDRV